MPRVASAACWLALAGTGGCSLLFPSIAEQCASDSECVARGASFTGHVCRLGTCVASIATPADAGNDANRDASSSADHDRPDAAADACIDHVQDGPREPGTEGGDGGLGGDANADGSVLIDAGCASNEDCLPADPNRPEVACDRTTGTCLQLTTEDCPFVIGDFGSKSAPPVFLGAFATLPKSAPQNHPSFLNYALAIKEFTLAGGIPSWDPVNRSTGLRIPVAVVCNAEGDVHKAMVHLGGVLRVPAVVAALDSVMLRTEFVNDAFPNQTFVVNPFGADSTLTSLTTDGLLWHMLGQPRDNAPAYSALLPRVEAYVRTLQALTSPTRVATVKGNATVTSDLAEAAIPVMRWNGRSAEENRLNGHYLNIAVDSVLSGNKLSSIDVSNAVASLVEFKPNIIVSFASAEFVEVLKELEAELEKFPSAPKPFYLLGPYNMESSELLSWIGAGTIGPNEAKRKRFAGIGVASACDRHALSAYEIRFLGEYLHEQYALGQENYYDAMYFALYSIVGAGHLSPLRGSDVAQGALRLLDGTSKDVGPADMGDIFGILVAPNDTFSLFGTLGPPTFTRSTGARVGKGSVYCIARQEGGGPVYAYDVMRLESTDGGDPPLSGTFPCYSGL